MDDSVKDKFVILYNMFSSHHGETLKSETNSVGNLTQAAIKIIDLWYYLVLFAYYLIIIFFISINVLFNADSKI